jgi:hypothetical protein
VSRGSAENFDQIVVELAKNTKQYEAGQIKHYQFADKVDVIFGSYGWDKASFYKELNARLGIQTNDAIREAKEAKGVKKVKKVKVKLKAKPKPTIHFHDGQGHEIYPGFDELD